MLELLPIMYWKFSLISTLQDSYNKNKPHFLSFIINLTFQDSYFINLRTNDMKCYPIFILELILLHSLTISFIMQYFMSYQIHIMYYFGIKVVYRKTCLTGGSQDWYVQILSTTGKKSFMIVKTHKKKQQRRVQMSCVYKGVYGLMSSIEINCISLLS